MPIRFFEQSGVFHLYHKKFSLLLSIEHLPNETDTVLFRYFGAPVSPSCLQDEELQRDRWISFNTYNAVYPFAVPTAGHGDFRPAQISIWDEDGSQCTILEYCGYTISEGKRPLEGLPATYAQTPEQATTLTLMFQDKHANATVYQEYSVLEDVGAVAVN